MIIFLRYFLDSTSSDFCAKTLRATIRSAVHFSGRWAFWNSIHFITSENDPIAIAIAIEEQLPAVARRDGAASCFSSIRLKNLHYDVIIHVIRQGNGTFTILRDRVRPLIKS